jgi:hypothetical protein
MSSRAVPGHVLPPGPGHVLPPGPGSVVKATPGTAVSGPAPGIGWNARTLGSVKGSMEAQ